MCSIEHDGFKNKNPYLTKYSGGDVTQSQLYNYLVDHEAKVRSLRDVKPEQVFQLACRACVYTAGGWFTSFYYYLRRFQRTVCDCTRWLTITQCGVRLFVSGTA